MMEGLKGDKAAYSFSPRRVIFNREENEQNYNSSNILQVGEAQSARI